SYDLQDDAVARRWAAEAAQKKPWRPALWDLFADLLLKEATSPLRILELGAGPGLLAARILREVPVSEYVPVRLLGTHDCDGQGHSRRTGRCFLSPGKFRKAELAARRAGCI